MDENFYDNEFEKFLQQQVKHHRMYPSDAVWKGIYKQMHGHKRWPGLYFFAILMVAALTVCTVFIESEPIVYPQQAIAKTSTVIYNQLNPEQTTEHTLRQINKQQTSFSIASIDDYIVSTDVDADQPGSQDQKNEVVLTYADLNTTPDLNTELVHTSPVAIAENDEEDISAVNTPIEASTIIVAEASAQSHEEETLTKKTASLTDEYLEQHPDEIERIKDQQIRTKPSKWQLQFYITPSLNYRRIIDNKPETAEFNGPVATNNEASASKVIRYKPGMGIEMGFGVLYGVTDRLKIKTALQYNIRQFNIEAYSGNIELSKIAVQRNGFTDTIMKVTRYRSSGGYRDAELVNKYHQISIPVGVEYAIVNSKRFGINVSGTLQPTYTFSPSSYLLTSDYKSYADGTSMLRKWNINSSLEATISLKAGNVQWKFGPQLRYQLLPTYSDGYAIKEYLIDYGFKIGFTKTIQ